MDEELNLMDDLLGQTGKTSSNMDGLEAGSKERGTEAAIYDHQLEAIMKFDDQAFKQNLEQQKFELAQKESDQRLEMEKALNDAKIEAEKIKAHSEEMKAKSEKWTLWSRVGIAAAALGADIGMGILYLKYNAKLGGMTGKDGQKWFDQIRRIKL